MNLLQMLQGVYMSSSSSLKTLGTVVGIMRKQAPKSTITRELDDEQLQDVPLVYKPGYVPRQPSPESSDVETLIETLAVKHGVSPDIALAFAKIESGLDPDAVSPTGAIGLFQLTTSAISEVRRRFPTEYYDPLDMDLTDPRWNANTGILFIKTIARDYVRVPVDETYNVSDLSSVYAAYNVGIGNLRKLERGNFQDPALIKAVRLQARKLSASGTRGYMASVERVLNEYLS